MSPLMCRFALRASAAKTTRAADRLPGTVLIDSIPSGEDRLNILQGSGAMRYKLRGCGSQLLRPTSMAGPLQCSGI